MHTRAYYNSEQQLCFATRGYARVNSDSSINPSTGSARNCAAKRLEKFAARALVSANFSAPR